VTEGGTLMSLYLWWKARNYPPTYDEVQPTQRVPLSGHEARFIQKASDEGLFQGDPLYYITGYATPQEMRQLYEVIKQNRRQARGEGTMT
jgi:hypothetical protein